MTFQRDRDIRLECNVMYVNDKFIAVSYEAFTIFVPTKNIKMTRPYHFIPNTQVIVRPTYRIPGHDDRLSKVFVGDIIDIVHDEEIIEIYSKDIDMWNIAEQTTYENMITFIYWLLM